MSKSIERLWSFLNNISFNEAKPSLTYFFYCSEGSHYFMAKYSNLKRTEECPHCHGGRFMRGVNDISTMRVELLPYWDKTNIITPENVHYREAKKQVKWICSNNHVFMDTPLSQCNNFHCTMCSGRVASYENNLRNLFPNIAKDWSHLNEHDSSSVVPGSGKKVLWKCHRGHESWEKVYIRVKNCGCMKCRSFKYTHKELFREFSSKNIIDPLFLTFGSSKKVLWDCKKCGYEYECSIKNRLRGRSCGICYGAQIIVGLNDLKNKKPVLSTYWDKSNILSPEQVYFKSNRIFKWSCEFCNYKWAAKPAQDKYCPKCLPRHRSNFERMVYSELVKIIDSKNIETCFTGFKEFGDIDIYIKDKNLAIECNGVYWHSNESILLRRGITSKKYHSDRLSVAKKLGLTMVFIWEDDWSNNKEFVIDCLKNFIGTSIVDSSFLRLE